LLAFCGASIRSGANLVLETFWFDALLESADLVLTGEGRIDEQTAFGKAIHAVALLAAKHEVPVIAFAGSVQEEAAKLARQGIGGVVPIVAGPIGEEEAMRRAGELLQSAAERTMRLLLLGQRLASGAWRGGGNGT
jgi:glycerate kinase